MNLSCIVVSVTYLTGTMKANLDLYDYLGKIIEILMAGVSEPSRLVLRLAEAGMPSCWQLD